MKFEYTPKGNSSDPENGPEEIVYTKDNRHVPKKFDTLTNIITSEEAAQLRAFILEKLPESVEGEKSQQHVLPYRTDEWDSSGVINKLQEVAKAHIRNAFYMEGAVEPRKFLLLKSEQFQSYFEEYPSSYINNKEILYTAVVTPVYSGKDYSGETLYTMNGEGFVPKTLDMVIHRNEAFNNWSVQEVLNGTRLDLVMVFREVNMDISYDYAIDQSPEDQEEF